MNPAPKRPPATGPARYFDAALQPAGLTAGDLEQLVHFGVRAGLARMSPTPRPRDAAELEARWEDLLTRELPRLARAGLETYALLGIPHEARPDRGFETALHRLVPLLGRRRAVAIGPVGLGSSVSADRADEHSLRRHLEVAHEVNRPLVVQLAGASARSALQRLLDLLDDGHAEPARVLIEGAARPAYRVLRERGYTVALRPQPHRLSAAAAAQLVSQFGSEGLVLASGAGSGHGDLLAVPKIVSQLEDRGLTPAVVRRVSFTNAATFFRLDPQDL